MDSTISDAQLDSLLTPTPNAASAGVRDAILKQTMGRVRGRNRTKWVKRVSAWAACFLAGMGTWSLVSEDAPPPKVVVLKVRETVPRQEPVPLMPRPTADELEIAAEKTLEQVESARLFREAGDRFLKEEANYDAALRCYRNFLDMAQAVDLKIVETDTWLLMSLKHARQTEVKHANRDN